MWVPSLANSTAVPVRPDSSLLFFDKQARGLAELGDASHFHDRGFLLPLCKASGLLTIRVDATKSLAVLVKQSHLPMMMFSPCVFFI